MNLAAMLAMLDGHAHCTKAALMVEQCLLVAWMQTSINICHSIHYLRGNIRMHDQQSLIDFDFVTTLNA